MLEEFPAGQEASPGACMSSEWVIKTYTMVFFLYKKKFFAMKKPFFKTVFIT
jgi:hypothetical protein